MSYSIKQLGPEDIDSAKALLRIFSEAFDDEESHQRAMPHDEYLRLMLKNSRFIALVAIDGESVVGGLTAHILDKFDQESREIYVYDLAVQAQHRRKRVATNLIRNLKQMAGTLGVSTLYVQADATDDGAIRLYENNGTKRSVYHFDISL